MSWSLGEIRSLATKAAKGSGFEWGMADDAGFAVEWLHQRGAPAINEFAGLLTWREACDEDVTATCPIFVGTQISDIGSYQDILPKNICNPLLLTPFIASTLPQGEVVEIHFQDSLLRVSSDALQIEAMDIISSEPVVCSANSVDMTLAQPVLETRVSFAYKSAYEVLNRVAQATYAPSTEESRLKGAGAGNSDND